MRAFSCLLLLAGACLNVPAQTNAPAASVRRMSLQDCVVLALQHNLDLQIDRYNPQISLYALKGTYGAYDPTLSLKGQHEYKESPHNDGTSDDNSFTSGLTGNLPSGATYSLDGTTTDTYGSRTSTNGLNTDASASATLTQPLLKNFWIDQNRLNIRVAKNRLKYSEQTLRLQIMQVITTLEQSYFDLIYKREFVIVQQKAVELADRLAAENRTKLQVGALAPLDLQSAESQAASSRADLIKAISDRDTQERNLKQLFMDNYKSWVQIGIEPTIALTAPQPLLNVQDSWAKGLTQRPEILQARLDIEKQGIQLKFDKNQLFPQLDVFGTIGYSGAGKEFSSALYDVQRTQNPFYIYGGQISVPLGNIAARNTLKSDKVSLQQLLLTLKQQEQSVMITIDNDIGTIRANFDQVHAATAARQYAEAALDAEQKKLENGKSTTYTVLQMQRDLTTARGKEISTLDDYNKSLSQLSLDEGSTIERLGLNLQVK